MAATSTAPKAAGPRPKSAPPIAKPVAAKHSPSTPASARGAGPLPVYARPHAAPSAIAGSPQSIAVASQPIAPHVQQAIENSLSIDLNAVHLHTDQTAHTATSLVSARAFTYGKHIFLGSGERPDNIALLAHEATHVVQQQGVPTVQRSAPGQTNALEREADRASQAVSRGEKFTVSERVSTPRVAPIGFDEALDYAAEHANAIWGFRMFTIVLGVNPINMKPVDKSPANVLRAVVELLPVVGPLITKALDKYGIFEKVGSWVSQQIDTLGIAASSIKNAIDQFLSSLHLRDLLHPGDAWERAKHLLTEPIDRIIGFAKGLYDGVVKFVKDAVLVPLAELAQKTRGWDLLIAVMGKNPITGEKVPQDFETLIAAFMKFIGEEEIYNNLKKSGAIPKAIAWFKGTLSELVNFVSQVPALFITALKSLVIEDLLDLLGAFKKVAGVFGTFVVDFLGWAGNAVWTLLQIIFEVVAPGAIPYIKKLGAAFRTILKNPIAFVGNLVKAGKLGFQHFADSIGTHLKAGFIEWLTGTLSGVYLPKSFDLREIVQFVMSVLALTWQSIRGKLVKAVGENAVKAMETGFSIVVTLVKDGPAAAWEQIKDQLSSLKDTVIAGIMDFVVSTIVKKAIAQLASLLVPGGAFVQAIISIYNTIMVFVEKLSKIVQVVTAFLDSMMDIASGAVERAAKKVESVLAGLITLAISFLAGFLGLGKISDKVLAIITKVRDTIDKALDKVVDWVVSSAKKLFGKAFGKKEDVKEIGGVQVAAEERVRSKLGAETTLAYAKKVLADVATELRPQGLKSLTLETGPADEDSVPIIYAEASPKLAMFALDAENIVPRGRSEVMEIRMRILGHTQGFELSRLAPYDPSAGTYIPAQPYKSAGGAVLESASELESERDLLKVVTWNTSNESLRSSASGSHAERQFHEWLLRGDGKQYLGKISEITVSLSPWSPCTACTDHLVDVIKSIKPKPHSAVLEWGKPYKGAPPNFVTRTTTQGVGELLSAGWIVNGQRPNEAEDTLKVKKRSR